MSELRHWTDPGPRSLPGGSRGRGQAGMSLIEILLAVTLMSVVVLGIAAGVQTTASVSGRAGARAALQEALNTTADRVATLPYPGCATEAALTSSEVAALAPAGYTADVVKVTHLVPAGACSAATSALMLKIKVVDRNDDAAALTAEIVLRNSEARPA